MIDMLPAVRPSSGPSAVAAGMHPDPVQRHAELLGGDLRQRGEDALAELDLADPHADVPPSGTTGSSGRAAGWRARSLGSAAGRRRVEPWAGVRRHAHGSLDPACPAATTASMIRRWAPQRHRLRSRARGDRGGVGGGVLVEQRRGADGDPGDAEAALSGLVVEQRLLHRVQRVPGCQALDGDDRAPGGGPDRCVAGGDDGVVQAHEAGTAEARDRSRTGCPAGRGRCGAR